ncbi:MAG: DUF1015 domain-containing protein [Balneolaceae bacterium]
MAIVHSFHGWLPKPEKAKQISSVPYDVINSEEAREQAKGNLHSFLHVIRPEIDLPEGTAFNADEVYEKGAENLKALLDSSVLEQDENRSLYVYQLETPERTQTGIFACAAVEDYDSNIILKHELTRPDKEDDRTRHILTQSAHAEPIMLTFKDTADISSLMNKTMVTTPPYIDFEADDGVRHRIWKVKSPAELGRAFANIPHLYVADGHHRCKSASRAAEELRKKKNSYPGESEFEYFPAVLFPLDQMKILPYNRIIKTVTDEQFQALTTDFNLTKNAPKAPSNKGEVSLYFDGTWHGLKLPKPSTEDAVEQLDVTRLQNSILSPVFNIENPRTDSNVDFVGGIRGTGELEKLVDTGKADLAISMFPTAIEELVEVSDQGKLMPPKSTWFEPKIRSGLIIHTF